MFVHVCVLCFISCLLIYDDHLAHMSMPMTVAACFEEVVGRVINERSEDSRLKITLLSHQRN